MGIIEGIASLCVLALIFGGLAYIVQKKAYHDSVTDALVSLRVEVDTLRAVAARLSTIANNATNSCMCTPAPPIPQLEKPPQTSKISAVDKKKVVGFKSMYDREYRILGGDLAEFVPQLVSDEDKLLLGDGLDGE